MFQVPESAMGEATTLSTPQDQVGFDYYIYYLYQVMTATCLHFHVVNRAF